MKGGYLAHQLVSWLISNLCYFRVSRAGIDENHKVAFGRVPRYYLGRTVWIGQVFLANLVAFEMLSSCRLI